jgi:SAM-dependent methyltransferase
MHTNDNRFSFWLDASHTPIYQRIVDNIERVLTSRGHKVIQATTEEQKDVAAYLKRLRAEAPDYCIVTNPVSTLSLFLKEQQRYVFEIADTEILFIHHDNTFRPFYKTALVCHKMEAYLRIKRRSCHFCIENYKLNDLRQLGLRAHKLFHATEFNHGVEKMDFDFDMSFVGHFLPACSQVPEFFFNQERALELTRNYWERLAGMQSRIEPAAVTYADSLQAARGGKAAFIDFLADKYHYLSDQTSATRSYRGEILSRITAARIDAFGGDPGYLNGGSNDRRIQSDTITYHPPTRDYQKTIEIYNRSRINLNISSLQFDEGLNNRIMDVGGAGGFLLTDYKEDLREITSVSEEISYRTIEELNHKIAYYLANEQDRFEIADVFHRDVIRRFSYESVLDDILKIIDAPDMPQEALMVDLGSGPRKPDGYVGVDISPRPGVDIIADLTRRFPWPENSVDRLRAHNIIEHLPDSIHTMNEIWRVCRHGAKVEIRVPSTDGRGAFQDPTHVSFWNVNSFKYYSRQYPAYFDLCRDYGFKGEYRIVELQQEETQEQVYQLNVLLETVKEAA